MVQFNITYDVANSPDYNALNNTERQTILDTLTAAAIWWTRYLSPVNVTLDMSIYIDAEPFGPGTLALGGPDLFLNGEQDEGVPVWEPVTQTKVATGVDPNGADADLAIWLSPGATHENFYFAPLDVDGIYTVPSGMIDAMSVFLHEIGHGLGFISFSDFYADPNFLVERTTYDKFIRSTPGTGTVFDGPTAGLVRLHDSSMSHTSESQLAHDLMSPQIGSQEIARITATDVAIMRDYGMPMRGPTAGDDILYGFQQIDIQITGADTISAGAGNDIVHGLTGNDNLSGGAGNDQLYGDHNNDQLFGGDGNDILDGGLGDDTINGGGGIDYVRYAGLRADYSVSRVGSNWLVSGPEGSDTISTAERLQFSDQTTSTRLAPVFDFSGEGNGDILFQNTDSTVAVWLQNGLTSTGADAIGASAAGGWVVKGASDLDGDANADILLQNSGTGAVAAWLMSGLTVIGADAVHANAGLEWSVIGTGDFNSDLKYDVLLQNNTTGQCAVWLMNGVNLLGGDAIAASANGGWQIKGVGDFNGDTRSDVLLQNSVTNQVAIWMMNGLAVTSADVVAASAGTDWKVKGTGDFNADGKSDILLQNQATSQAAVWLMNGLALTGGDAIAASAAGGWVVEGSEDLDGNGSSDVLLQKADGSVAGWLMNGLNVVGAGAIGSNPGVAWQIISPTG